MTASVPDTAMDSVRGASKAPHLPGDLSAGVQAPAGILFVQISLPGGDRSLFNVIRNLDRSKYRSSLFLLKPECVNPEEISGFTNLIIGSTHSGRLRYGLFGLFRRLVEAAAAHDLVVGSLELDSTYLAYTAARTAGKPVVGWIRTTLSGYLDYKQRWHRPLLRAVYPRLDRVVCVNHEAAASILDLAGLREGQVEVIANSLDPQAVEARQQSAPSWDGAGTERPVVMAVGRLNPEKGFDLLIRAHRRLRDEGLDHLLVIMGKGPLREELTALARNLNVADTVILPGYFVNPYSAMKRAAVFALPSHVEGFPSVLLEALYLGVPIVATRCTSGNVEILDNGRYGLLVPPDDWGALADAIGALLRDPERRGQMSAAGRERIREFYAQNMVLRWQRLFDELLAGSAR